MFFVSKERKFGIITLRKENKAATTTTTTGGGFFNSPRMSPSLELLPKFHRRRTHCHKNIDSHTLIQFGPLILETHTKRRKELNVPPKNSPSYNELEDRQARTLRPCACHARVNSVYSHVTGEIKVYGTPMSSKLIYMYSTSLSQFRTLPYKLNGTHQPAVTQL